MGCVLTNEFPGHFHCNVIYTANWDMGYNKRFSTSVLTKLMGISATVATTPAAFGQLSTQKGEDLGC